MNLAAQGAQLFVLAGVVFLALGALLAAVSVRLFGARLSRWEPSTRHRALMLLAALPALSAVVLLFVASLPSLLALLVPGLDHCSSHQDRHAHLCFVHLPRVGIHTGLLVGLVFLASYALLRGGLAVSSAVRALRVVATLARTGEHRSDLGITIVETRQPVCFAAGLLRPRVLLSRGLFESLSGEQRAVILAHERAHVMRRDALLASVAQALAAFHLPGIGRWLVAELEVAAEQACDEEAARCVSDRVAVAAAILAFERAAQGLAAHDLGVVSAGFGARAVERRVEALLGDPPQRQSLRPVVIALSAAAAGLLLLANQLHHLTESVLSVIAH
jgi:Zn-dependent protease with chaperone function